MGKSIKDSIYEYVEYANKKRDEVRNALIAIEKIKRDINSLKNKIKEGEITLDDGNVIVEKEKELATMFNKWRSIRLDLLSRTADLYNKLNRLFSAANISRIKNHYTLEKMGNTIVIRDSNGSFVARVFPKEAIHLDIDAIFLEHYDTHV